MAEQIKYNKCIGKWSNSNVHTKAIGDFDMYEIDDKLFININGKEGGIMEGNWGEKQLISFIHDHDKIEATAFTVTYEMSFGKVKLAINENKGLFVILSYVENAEGIDHKNYYIREFFVKN